MPHLNWKESSVQIEVSSHPERELQILVQVSGAQLLELVTELAEIFTPDPFRPFAPELRHYLSERWILFWKKRESGSRVIFAHPEKDEWVGTVALEMEFAQQLLLSLKNLEVDQSLEVSQLGYLDPVSNLELIVKRVS